MLCFSFGAVQQPLFCKIREWNLQIRKLSKQKIGQEENLAHILPTLKKVERENGRAIQSHGFGKGQLARKMIARI